MILLFALLTLQSAPQPNAEVAELDLRTGAIVQSGWTEKAPVGSLIKPFTALAYAATHNYQYPEFECNGTGCWMPGGHGRVGIREAIAHSCNAYFTMLSASVHAEHLNAVLQRFNLDPMPETVDPRSFVGFGDAWRVKPLNLMRAYVELLSRIAEPGVGEILDGMAMSARVGTGKGAGLDVLIKTGTAPCVHAKHAPGDGYALAIYPAHKPEHAILVRLHSGTGAEAAWVLGAIKR